ncbi:MAG: type II secretion system GspH family protein [Lachnospiraceae bacterium]|nr:type II secretion system GspH family protein [Lachnospiraceae bacterium]
MKKMNKGFSMVELIIVIAIMAILAGALAPALIRYINKSRISTDIQTANTIAKAVQTALANEKGYDVADTTYNCKWTNVAAFYATSDSFTESFKTTVGANAPEIKSIKCISKRAAKTTRGDFGVWIDLQANEVEVKLGGNHIVYPVADECLTNEEVNCVR